MEKIVITGGLGYIGTELSKLYSGESRFKEIVVVDNRFVSERVKQLRDWGIEFVHGDILDEDLMKKVLKDADIVHHLAGITNVAYTNTESNRDHDKLIKKVGVEGSRNIINLSPKKCKIIFPSTHVVYEGFKDTKFNITEDTKVTPVLTYAKGKVKTEKDLYASDKNFIILRLGSAYGYSTDTARMNIMPNLFSRMASQNKTIKLFSGGIQHKSLVAVLDVARCFKFMAESDIERDTFHLTNENTTVKGVAKLCKKFNPKLKLTSTKDEIPNLGYTLSNKKLLDTGFEFLYDLETCVKEMIENWSKKKQLPELEHIMRGDKEYIDERGKISNYELTEPINLVGYIESKAGSVRANHYHPIQEQKCLLISGQYISVIKDLSKPNANIETKLINAGDLSIIKPNVAHTMVFTEDSVFLNLVRGEREHENYGITHTIPYKLVDEDMRQRLLSSYKKECRSCGNIHLERVISLGASPLANNLLDSADEAVETYPLEMNYCAECHNCQLSCVVPPENMFDNYLYVSSTSQTFRKHFEDTAKKYIKKFKLNKKSLVVDIGSNDGIALKPLMERGIRVVGVEPAKNIAKLANKEGVKTINSYFDKKVVSKILKTEGKADLVTASNVFAHADGLKEIAENAFNLLKNKGTFVIEVQYLLDTLKDLTFDNIYHEHVNYWSVLSLKNFFNKLDLEVVHVEHIDTHGGSIRVFIQRAGSKKSSSVSKFLTKEKEYGLDKIKTYKKFEKKIEDIKNKVNKNLSKIKSKSNKIVGYGSPAKATTALNYFGISSDDIDYIIEDNKLKHNKYLPGVTIPIIDKAHAEENIPDTILILAWNFAKEIKNNNQFLVKNGSNFISIKDLEN